MSSSSSGTDRRRGQRGGSVIEALVATALLGITVTVAITGWDAVVLGARRATAEAWARCVARAQMEAVLAAPAGSLSDLDSGSSPVLQDSRVRVDVRPTQFGGMTQVTVTVADPQTGGSYTLSALKADALSGTADPPVQLIRSGCPSP
jgi:type II secretory pathway pseudopilin PulG